MHLFNYFKEFYAEEHNHPLRKEWLFQQVIWNMWRRCHPLFSDSTEKARWPGWFWQSSFARHSFPIKWGGLRAQTVVAPVRLTSLDCHIRSPVASACEFGIVLLQQLAFSASLLSPNWASCTNCPVSIDSFDISSKMSSRTFVSCFLSLLLAFIAYRSAIFPSSDPGRCRSNGLRAGGWLYGLLSFLIGRQSIFSLTIISLRSLGYWSEQMPDSVQTPNVITVFGRIPSPVPIVPVMFSCGWSAVPHVSQGRQWGH